MHQDTKSRILSAINTAVKLDDYNKEDQVFSMKYPMTSTDMVYVLKHLATDFQFTINDEFIDALEMCTFRQLEELLTQYSSTAKVAG